MGNPKVGGIAGRPTQLDDVFARMTGLKRSTVEKPLDKQINSLNKKTLLNFGCNMINETSKSLTPIIKKLEEENATLKKSLHDAGELIEELKKKNKLFKKQLARFGRVFDNHSITKEVNDEINAERGQEVESLGGPEDFGIDEHEEDLIEKEKNETRKLG